MWKHFSWCLFLLLLVETGTAQSTPRTLLWRVAGNGFSTPCYLYGTMHIPDRRVYVLGDSVYQSIAYCKGFAMEVDPGDLIDTILSENASKSLSVSYKNILERELIPSGGFDAAGSARRLDSFTASMRLRYKDLSTAEILRLIRAYNRRRKNNMSTLLDLYLFDLAKKQGKILGGIEDIFEHRSVKLENTGAAKEAAFLEKQKKKYADIMEWMIETYVSADLDLLHQHSLSVNSGAELTELLFNRNAKMCQRIDSLGKIRPTFFAVGAGHLPGDSGLIDLLRRDGFEVSPVFSANKIVPGEYKMQNEVVDWRAYADADSSYIVQLPGKTTSVENLAGNIVMKVYKELSNDVVLMAGVQYDNHTGRSNHAVFEEFKAQMAAAGMKLNDVQPIARQGLTGYEFSYRQKNLYARMHLFYQDRKIFVFGVGAREKDSLLGAKCQYFLSHYSILTQRAPVSLLHFSHKSLLFSAAFPSTPTAENIPGSKTRTKEDVHLFSCVDTRSKMNYLLLVKEPAAGYFADYDSTIFTRTIKELTKGLRVINVQDEKSSLGGLPALKVSATSSVQNDSTMIYVLMARKNHRLYCLTTRGPATPEHQQMFDAYAGSFNFLPVPIATWSKVVNDENHFAAEVPGSLVPVKLPASDSANGTIFYNILDTISSIQYGVNILKVRQYFWANNREDLLSVYARRFVDTAGASTHITSNGDSVISIANTTSNGVAAKEVVFKNLIAERYTRIRLLLNGEQVFVLYVFGSNEMIGSADANRFFDSFKFSAISDDAAIYQSKTAKLLHDLNESDSITRVAAFAALQDLRFPPQDSALLIEALLTKYPRQPKQFLPVSVYLTGLIAQQYNPAVVRFIEKHYPLLKHKDEALRREMLNMLAGFAHEDAYNLLKKLLLTDLPESVDFDRAAYLIKSLPDQAKSLFPELEAKLNDASMAPFILDIAAKLIDEKLLSAEFIRRNEAVILATAKQLYGVFAANNSQDFYLAHVKAVLTLLAQVEQKAARRTLTDFFDLYNVDLTQTMLVNEAIFNRPLPEPYFTKFCMKAQDRINLYEALSEAGRRSYFTGEYASQLAFAETFISLFVQSRLNTENMKISYELISQQDISTAVSPGRYYGFKVTCSRGYFKETTINFIGPFSFDKTIYSIPLGKEQYSYFTFVDKKKNEAYLAEYLELIGIDYTPGLLEKK